MIISFLIYSRLLRTGILNVIRIISHCKILFLISLIMQNINLGLKENPDFFLTVFVRLTDIIDCNEK